MQNSDTHLHLLLFLDDSPATRRAVRYLAPLAQLGAVRITLLSAEANQARAETLFAEAEAGLAALLPTERRLRASTQERALALETRTLKPDVVVMGPPRQQGWARWLRGAQVNAVARRLTSSVLLIHGRPNELHRALVCTAGGEQIANDAALTRRLLGPLGGQATILHVVSQLPLLFRGTPSQEHVTEAYLRTNAEMAARIKAAEEQLATAGVKVKVRVRVGIVVEEILAELREGGYDLLVIGAHLARTPLERLLLEDISAELLLRSPVPVLLVQGAQ